MSKFRIKTAEVEAALFDGELIGTPDPAKPGKVIPLTCPAWAPGIVEVTTPDGPDWGPGSVCSMGDKLYFAEQDGDTVKTTTVHPGDWIVRRPRGQFMRMSAAEFAATYEPVE